MLRQLRTAIGMLLMLTVLTGIAYPLVITGISQAAFGNRADGSLIREDGEVVGSSLLAQKFTDPGYFHPRPSAVGYDSAGSGASNLGPTNPDLLAAIERRAKAYRTENGLSPDAEVPIDAVTASGSGLDPHISIANARLQADRVAHQRDLSVEQIDQLIDDNTDGRSFGFMGEPGVNVLELNLALDDETGSGGEPNAG